MYQKRFYEKVYKKWKENKDFLRLIFLSFDHKIKLAKLTIFKVLEIKCSVLATSSGKLNTK